MGVPKTKWSPEEEEALRKGVKKYGAGKWRFIQKDPVLGKILNQRSNVDLKDKWRNMYPGHSTADPTPDSDDDDRKSGSRSRGKSAGGRAASDSGGSHHRRGAANKDSGKRAVTPGVATKDTPNKDGSASKRRKAPVSEKAGGDVKAGDVKAGAAGDDPFLFLVNGQYRTAEEVTRDAARAVRDAERAAAAAKALTMPSAAATGMTESSAEW